MPSLRARWSELSLSTTYLRALCLGLAVCLSLSTLLPAQGTGGRVLGLVSDPTGAVLSGVKVTATNEATGVTRNSVSNDSGDYVFPDLPVGTYTLSFDLTGFKKAVRRSIALDINQAITLNMTMQLGEQKEIVDVTAEAPLVDTSSTQLGAVVNNRSVNELPLNARDSYQFLQLQPGVQSQLGSSGGTFYGSDSAGSVSVNGGRSRANNFSVNGGDANDQFVNLPTVQPTPDAIEEFRVISNTFDAEYGRNSGAVVNVVTKSGTNQWHGNMYEYFRNKDLNAQGFFNTVKPQFNQNQFGGTFGGPVKKDRTFFFVSYEGRRVRQGVSGETVAVPTAAERTGDFSGDGAALATTYQPGVNFGGQISDDFVAQALSSRGPTGAECQNAINTQGGAAITAGAYYGAHPQDPTDPNSPVMPGIFTVTKPGLPNSGLDNQVPSACMDPVAQDLLRFVPGANRSDGNYQAVPASADNQDQFTLRFDHHINDHQNFSFYYYYTNDKNFQPFYDFQASGANIPGFGANVGSRYQQINPSHTWTISNALVNEFRFTYMREGQLTFQHPQQTGSVQSSCTSAVAPGMCFGGTSDSQAINDLITGQISDPTKAGITTGLPANRTGVPFIDVSGGVNFGNGWEGELPQVGNSFMWADNLTWVKGNHQFKFGADVRRSRFDQTLYYNVSGDFTFDGSTANAVQSADNYPSYLLGLADSYTQGSAQRENVRSTGLYLFAQDSWKIRPNITLNYGLRWELDTPLTDVLHHVQSFRPGQNTTQYPCTLTTDEQASFGVGDCASAGVLPTGLVVPGDQGVQAGLTQTYYKAFAPRIGIAWSPGASGKTSIRAGWGLFYNPMEQLVLEQFGAEPPFGGSTYLPSTFLNTPFVPQAGGYVAPNPFTGILSPKPGTDTDWASFRPMLLYGDFQPHMRTQYTAQYNFTIQRELAKDIVLQLGYVGSQGHRLLASHDINPGNPQTCLDLQAISDYYGPGAHEDDSLSSAYSCGPFYADNQFLLPANTIPNGYTVHMPYGPTPTVSSGNPDINLVGIRPYSSPNCNPMTGAGCPLDGISIFSNIFAEDTIAASAYNSFQASVEKRFSHGLQFQAAYTLSKSLDWASSFEETVNPFNYRSSRALSLFNSKQRFVINYVWDIPVPKYSGFKGKLLDDWQFSGIVQLQSGFPIRIQTQDDNELISSLFFLGASAPQMAGKTPQILNPKVLTHSDGSSCSDPSDPDCAHRYLNLSQFSDPTLGTFATTPRSICCGPGENQWDITFAKRVTLSESKYFQFRADIFNLFNKTQFVNPDGNFSNTTFGQVLQARDPRLLQFALKFYF